MDKPIIDSIEGDKVVVVRTPEGNRVGSRGTEINFGDIIKTGPHASAKVLYPDGSKLLVGRNTEMEVQPSRGGSQVSELRSGQVRGLIKKLKTQVNGPPRFIVRTRSAVMGVRGTDFVYNLEEATAKSEIRTLEGTVDVAKDEESLLQGKAVRVQRDQFVSTDLTSSVITPPQTFDRPTYVATLAREAPEIVALAKGDPDAANMSVGPSPAEVAAANGPNRFFAFQIAAMFLKQNNGGDTFTTELSFNPRLRLFGPIGIRGHVGIFPLKEQNKRANGPIGIEVAPLLMLSLSESLVVDAGLGLQGWWWKRSEPGPIGMVQVGWRLAKDKFFERIFVGFSRYQNGSILVSPVNEFKAGVGFQL